MVVQVKPALHKFCGERASVPVQVKDFKPVGDQVLAKFHDWVSSGADGASNWHLEKENHEGWRVNRHGPACFALGFASQRTRCSLSVMPDLDGMPGHSADVVYIVTGSNASHSVLN